MERKLSEVLIYCNMLGSYSEIILNSKQNMHCYYENDEVHTENVLAGTLKNELRRNFLFNFQ